MATPRRYAKPLPPFQTYVHRQLKGVLIALAVCATSLTIGTVGYHLTEGLPWLDAILNASMILTGMGPVDHLQTSSGKLFASGYALFSGLVFISTAAIVLTPAVRRGLHRLHLDMQDMADD